MKINISLYILPHKKIKDSDTVVIGLALYEDNLKR